MLALLGEEMEGTSDDNVLLVHKTTTIEPTDSPASLGLTTADIISEWLKLIWQWVEYTYWSVNNSKFYDVALVCNSFAHYCYTLDYLMTWSEPVI